MIFFILNGYYNCFRYRPLLAKNELDSHVWVPLIPARDLVTDMPSKKESSKCRLLLGLWKCLLNAWGLNGKGHTAAAALLGFKIWDSLCAICDRFLLIFHNTLHKFRLAFKQVSKHENTGEISRIISRNYLQNATWTRKHRMDTRVTSVRRWWRVTILPTQCKWNLLGRCVRRQNLRRFLTA